MPHSIRRLLPLLCSILIVSIPLGCQTNNQAKREDVAPNAPRQISYQKTEQPRGEQHVVPRMNKTANRLATIATRVPGVSRAIAIVVGPYTIVGIDVNKKLDRARVGTIKYAVAQALKKDPQGKRALVTADVDLVQRLREINKDLMNGKPIAGIMDELAEIAGRIAPQPSNVR